MEEELRTLEEEELRILEEELRTLEAEELRILEEEDKLGTFEEGFRIFENKFVFY